MREGKRRDEKKRKLQDEERKLHYGGRKRRDEGKKRRYGEEKRPEIHRQLVKVYCAKRRCRWEVLDHPPYSRDLDLSDFHRFGPLKKHLSGKRFNTDTAVQQVVITWLQVLDAHFFYAGNDALVHRWNKCLDKYTWSK
ncbi:hypothetical protein ANN_12118 [Periplaneta americana]|uniref:Histone-lysine N-methyltransferase SETMAR n=1 Tax=Periplaneta americana TaxID=6978 RepID=A0ABQ8T8S7_PERAM|nr:hypothetical protein ANN_12118 [Periplaneta americana]